MRGDHDRRAQLVEFLEQVEQAHGDAVVDVAGRFVGEQQARPADHRAGDGDALLLAAGQRGRKGVNLVGEPDPGEQLGDVLVDLVLALATDLQRQRDVLERGQMVEQAEILEHHADSPAHEGGLAARERRHVAPEQRGAAAARPARQVHQLEQRGLAGAARPGQEMKRARL